MSGSTYKEPSLAKTYLGHAVGTALIGALLPNGDRLGWLHSWMWPIVEWIPNAGRLTNRASDPIFAQTFVGMSALVAIACLLLYIQALRRWGGCTRSFERSSRRFLCLAYIYALVGLLIALAWSLPIVDPVSKGRAYFILQLASSGTIGVVTAINQILIGAPMLFLQLLLVAHLCTRVVNRTHALHVREAL
ncbi:hypothetical protein [Ramlibacter rhizophilus]|uniref:Uncharacterized protein n=1 Tax=Ramlibacter rhizophilus TaxID=1781167 RepID=A0A4Z0BBE1_9BURK|nr:hypothetical protein [Ramlibacter rhizophilus]TFY96442.1 hypothetical protein EZ242_20660 [Ramlibacter rhizophilus]